MDNRRRIVDSAKRMFWRNGYSTTSPKQVMADSGVGQGSYYHHFPSKTGLGKEVVDENGRDLLEAVQAAMAGLPTGRERLLAFLKSADSALEGCRVGGFAYDAGVLADPELQSSLRVAFTELADLLENVVREGQEDGSLPSSLDPVSTAAALLAVVEGAFILARATGQQSSADAATAGAKALLTGL
ncbi:TetR/AcrR family transcriptional regulator [Kineosporia babensis]|uniref:TetR/AcrR family transcriptional regulator n=1 Tax=Kineosporia babensis TaxID=499548 RepID=A0A9X1NIK3_9ACTN|nr:TetR/AcrR family transcriptional regulator [Kineosporia babensis]MCD5314431.1 TetR/AcrR family transcriptional regulator [Kineosporia babensis]